MNAPRILGVAVIGLGIGEQHARAYIRAGNCRLRWLYDLDRSRMTQAVDVLGQGAAAESFESVLADDSVDVVSIASYDDAHFAQVIAALRAGKHVFVEKPLCRSSDELRAVRQAWEASGDRHLVSNLVLRAAPLYRWLKQAIGAGDFGTIYAFDGDYLYGRLHKITDGWRRHVDDYSVMQGGGVHLVDLMLWLTGQMPSAVTAVGNRLCTEGTAFRFNDYVSTTFQFRSGLIGRVTANFGCVHPHQHVVRVFGSKATFVYDDAGPRMHLTRDPSAVATPVHLPALPASKGDLIPEFVRGVLDGGDRRGPAQREFDVIRACIAADEALWAEKPITIEDA